MSDWEEDMYDDDEEDDELSFEDDSDNENNKDDALLPTSDEMNAESSYFKAKHLKEEGNLTESINVFDKIVSNDKSSCEYKFKATKQLLKIYEQQRSLGQVKVTLSNLFAIKDEIDNYYFSSSILKIVSRIHPNLDYSEFQLNYLHHISNLTLKEKNSTFEKVRVKCDLLISQLFTLMKDYGKAQDILTKLENQVLEMSNNTKNTFFLEIITSQILILLTHKFDLNELERLVMLTKSIDVGIPQMRILGIKNEGSGMILMYAEDYSAANCYFLDAFKNFNDSGDERRVVVLAKYIITSILSKLEVNPFQSSDFQGFLKIKVIDFLMNVYESVNNLDTKQFNELLNSDVLKNLSNDFEFLADFIPSLRELIYTEYIRRYISEFDRIEFEFFTNTLEIDLPLFKKMLFKLHNTGKIVGFRFDFVERYITRCDSPSIEIDAYKFIDKAFAFYDISNEKIKDIFKSEFEQLLKNDLTKEHDSIERKTQSQFNLRQYDGPLAFSSDLSFINLNQVNMGLDKTLLNENLDVLTFNTAYNTDTLRALSKKLLEFCLINKDLSKNTHIRNNILDCVNKFISIARNSIPIQKEKNLSYVNQIIDSRVTNEFNRFFKTDTAKVGNLIDFNIPDVIQTSTMNQLEPPLNPDFKNDPDILLSQQEKQFKRLKLVSDSILLVARKQNEADVRFCNIKPSLHSTLSRTKLKRPASEMSKFKIDRLRNTNNTFDFSETASTDNMSIDEADEAKENDGPGSECDECSNS